MLSNIFFKNFLSQNSRNVEDVEGGELTIVKYPERRPDTRGRGNSSPICVQTFTISFHAEKRDVCGALYLFVLQYLTVQVLNFA